MSMLYRLLSVIVIVFCVCIMIYYFTNDNPEGGLLAGGLGIVTSLLLFSLANLMDRVKKLEHRLSGASAASAEGLPVTRCPACGAEYELDYAQCPECGHRNLFMG